MRLFPLDDGLAFAGGRLDLDLGIERIAAAGHQLDDLALAIAQRRSQFTDALKQAVVADVDLPRIHPGLAANRIRRSKVLGRSLIGAESDSRSSARC